MKPTEPKKYLLQRSSLSTFIIKTITFAAFFYLMADFDVERGISSVKYLFDSYHLRGRGQVKLEFNNINKKSVDELTKFTPPPPPPP